MKKNKRDCWLPNVDQHFVPFQLGEYQTNQLKQALSVVPNKHVAVDVGAHVGHMSKHFSKFFDIVVSFEPEPENAKCFQKNLRNEIREGKIIFHPIALGDLRGLGSLTTPCSSNTGAWEVVEDARGSITIDRLDDYAFEHLDLIKLDCQGYEEKVLRGATRLIEHFRPVMFVECLGTPRGKNKKEQNTPLVEYILSLGYEQLYNTTKNICFVPKESK